MCGINGQAGSQYIDKATFLKMRDSMSHRGPDDAGCEFFQNNRVALGHRRLSIIDLSAQGRQPICNEDKTVWITFNGEIYNYQELKLQLQQKGHSFQSNTDTEVIVHGYEEWGEAVLSKLKGMFAFGIWDERKQKLFLARDRFGIKPLYYYTDQNKIVFASEIKGIISDPSIGREIDFDALGDFFVYRFIPSPKSIWKNIHKLPPAHYLEYSCQEGIKVHQYWEIPTQDESSVNEIQVVGEAKELLEQSIKAHLVSDVPVGVFLSGGYDSSTIVHFLNKLGYPTNSFSIGFKDWDQSEHGYAQLVADQYHTRHYEEIIGKETLDLTEKLAYFYDEPLGGSSFLPTYRVSKLASEHVKVVLAGDGGDEVFAGYNWYKDIYSLYHQRAFLSKIKTQINGKSHYFLPAYSKAMSWAGYHYHNLNDLFHGDISSDLGRDDLWLYKKYCNHRFGPVKTFQLLDYHTFMPEVILTKVDRASMANSLEVRVPFLDHELTEYMMRFNESVYYNHDVNKKILYQIMREHFSDTIMHKPKKGFGAPVNTYQDLDVMKAELLGGSVVNDSIINRKYVEDLIACKSYRKIWPIYIFEMWYRTWNN